MTATRDTTRASNRIATHQRRRPVVNELVQREGGDGQEDDDKVGHDGRGLGVPNDGAERQRVARGGVRPQDRQQHKHAEGRVRERGDVEELGKAVHEHDVEQREREAEDEGREVVRDVSKAGGLHHLNEQRLLLVREERDEDGQQQACEQRHLQRTRTHTAPSTSAQATMPCHPTPSHIALHDRRG